MLVRNTLGDYKILLDGNNCEIRWDYFEKLHEYQEAEGMHLGNKLRGGHINYIRQKMKVRFATQLFSKSVADALKLCKYELYLSEFQHCDATIQFINNFNDLFDIFNTHSIKTFAFKRALNVENQNEVFQKLTECANYISGLKLYNSKAKTKTKTYESVLTCPRKTGFVGFLICINNLKNMYNDYCIKQKLLLYIPTYKFSQDHVETFFACIRAHGGHNNNPTTIQFKSALKKLLINTEIKDIHSGNCISLENVSILHISSTKSIDIINDSTPTYRLQDNDNYSWDNLIEILECHSYFSDTRIITEFSEQIIAYIAGFIVKYLYNKIRCENCLSSLQSTDNNKRIFSLINFKNKYNLIFPSIDIFNVCKKCEIVLRFALKENENALMQYKFSISYLTSQVLPYFLHNDNIFSELINHSIEQNPLSNHRIHLIKCICEKYFSVRLFYISKQSKKVTLRHHYNKITLFSGW